MITEIRYKNFKALRDTTLPLGRFTLIVGANGTGKTTAMKALEIAKHPNKFYYTDVASIDLLEASDLPDMKGTKNVEIEITEDQLKVKLLWDYKISESEEFGRYIWNQNDGSILEDGIRKLFINSIKSFQTFSFDAEEISQTVRIDSKKELDSNGGNLAGILDLLKDTEPEKWKELTDELGRWFPEFDQILFDRSNEGKSIVLRTRFGKYKIKASDLSHGTRLALAFLTISYLPNPPKIVAFEEPERGVHPRLLRNIQEAMDRLAYPENYGEKREPVQVIATTHSPYLLDLYKDRREEIVIADKDENGVHFERLTDLPNIEKILREQDAPLGDVWFSGILGGVPAQL